MEHLTPETPDGPDNDSRTALLLRQNQPETEILNRHNDFRLPDEASRPEGSSGDIEMSDDHGSFPNSPDRPQEQYPPEPQGQIPNGTGPDYQPPQPLFRPTGSHFLPPTHQPPQYAAQTRPARRLPGDLKAGLIAMAALSGFLWLVGSLGGGIEDSSPSSVATPSPVITRLVTEVTLDGLKMGWDHMSQERQDQAREGWRAAKGDPLVEEEILDGFTTGIIEGWDGEGEITVSESTAREFLDWTLTTQPSITQSPTPAQVPTKGALDPAPTTQAPAPAPTTQAPAPAPTKAQEPTVPGEYRAALKQAQQYSDRMHMSKQGLYDQLTSEYGGQFEDDAAQYAIENVQADWNKNALESARQYRETLSMSREDIRDQLTSEYGAQFTEAQADYAIRNLD